MSNNAYYEGLKALAREKRELYGVETARLTLTKVRQIYNGEKIRIDLWPLPNKVKAIYMCDDGEFSVAIRRSLPIEPKIFALIHELKHHFADRELIGAGVIHCGDYNENELIEKGAEVFAAEFIYPEAEFLADLQALGLRNWKSAEVVARFKRNECKARVSYRFIVKRLEYAGIVPRGHFKGVKFQRLEDQIFGVPFYRRRAF